MLAWLAETAIGAFIKALLSTLREAWNDWLAVKSAREAGRAEATAENNEIAAKRVQEAAAEETETRKKHAEADIKSDPDAGLDTSFRRRDE